jgi:hypothetical protein
MHRRPGIFEVAIGLGLRAALFRGMICGGDLIFDRDYEIAPPIEGWVGSLGAFRAGDFVCAWTRL